MKKMKRKVVILGTLMTMLMAPSVVDADIVSAEATTSATIAAAATTTNIEYSNGVFYAWGNNAYGQLGTGDTADVPESKKVNLAQIAMYPTSPTYDAAGKFVKVEQVDGAIVAIDAYGALWTSGRNNVGQLGRGLGTNQNAVKFEKVSGKYTFADFNVSNDTIVASVKDRADEFMTFGKSTPNFNYIPKPKDKFIASLPLGWVSNRPVFYRKTGNNITEVQQFERYNDFSLRTKGSLEINEHNPDTTIGHVNVYTLQKYTNGKSTPDQRLQYFFDYDSAFLKIIADTRLDANGYKSSLEMNYYDASGYRTKRFKPAFQKGNDIESAEWIEDYAAKDGSKKTFYKRYDENGLVYPYAPEYTPDRNSKGGVWISMEETNYDKMAIRFCMRCLIMIKQTKKQIIVNSNISGSIPIQMVIRQSILSFNTIQR